MKIRIKIFAVESSVRFLDWCVGALPKRVLNHLTMGNIGRLTANTPALHHVEVPTINVQQIGMAMKYEEGIR